MDFRNTVIVMTSNLGSDLIQDMTGEEDYASMKTAVMGVVSTQFRPEFINRIDEVVVFHALQQAQIRAIADIQVDHLRQRLEEQEIALELTPAALDKLGEAGFDPIYGARPLRRAVQALIETPLASALLGGEFTRGDRIRADVDGAVIGFTRQ